MQPRRSLPKLHPTVALPGFHIQTPALRDSRSNVKYVFSFFDRHGEASIGFFSIMNILHWESQFQLRYHIYKQWKTERVNFKKEIAMRSRKGMRARNTMMLMKLELEMMMMKPAARVSSLKVCHHMNLDYFFSPRRFERAQLTSNRELKKVYSAVEACGLGTQTLASAASS